MPNPALPARRVPGLGRTRDPSPVRRALGSCAWAYSPLSCRPPTWKHLSGRQPTPPTPQQGPCPGLRRRTESQESQSLRLLQPHLPWPGLASASPASSPRPGPTVQPGSCPGSATARNASQPARLLPGDCPARGSGLRTRFGPLGCWLAAARSSRAGYCCHARRTRGGCETPGNSNSRSRSSSCSRAPARSRVPAPAKQSCPRDRL